MPGPTVSTRSRADVLVVGGGVIGLSVALELAQRGLGCTVFTGRTVGIATPASAGLLAPSVEHTPAVAGAFLRRALDLYPEYLDQLERASGVSVPLHRGLIEILPPAEAARPGALSGRELAALEPGVAAAAAGIFHPTNGSVDSRLLWEALRSGANRSPRIEFVDWNVQRLELGDGRSWAMTEDGAVHEAPRVVLAAGAWINTIHGLPRRLPVEPVRGQMISLARAAVRHAVMAPAGYLVPRGETTIAGATMERVGFDAGTTGAAFSNLAAMAKALVPGLGDAPVSHGWAGLRPVTPDLLPILGPEAEAPALLYACGHSRNGILLAAITAQSIAALLLGNPPADDITPFLVTRFSPASS